MTQIEPTVSTLSTLRLAWNDEDLESKVFFFSWGSTWQNATQKLPADIFATTCADCKNEAKRGAWADLSGGTEDLDPLVLKVKYVCGHLCIVSPHIPFVPSDCLSWIFVTERALIPFPLLTVSSLPAQLSVHILI